MPKLLFSFHHSTLHILLIIASIQLAFANTRSLSIYIYTHTYIWDFWFLNVELCIVFNFSIHIYVYSSLIEIFYSGCGTLYCWLGKRGDVEERSGGSEDRIGQGEIAEEEGEALQCDGVPSPDHDFAVVLDCRFDVRSQIALKAHSSVSICKCWHERVSTVNSLWFWFRICRLFYLHFVFLLILLFQLTRFYLIELVLFHCDSDSELVRFVISTVNSICEFWFEQVTRVKSVISIPNL